MCAPGPHVELNSKKSKSEKDTAKLPNHSEHNDFANLTKSSSPKNDSTTLPQRQVDDNNSTNNNQEQEFDLPKPIQKQQLALIQAGAVVGEWGLMQDTPRSATVTSETNCTLMVITRESYRSVLADYRKQCWRIDRSIVILQNNNLQRSARDIEALMETLQQATSLRMAKDVKAALCECASYRFVEKGQVVFPQGIEPDGFYFLIRGGCQNILGSTG